MPLTSSPWLRFALGCLALATTTGSLRAESPYQAPASPRATYSFNIGWKFIRQDVAGAEAATFDDSAWSTVSTPHTWNDTDTYRAIINHSSGDVSGEYLGIGWYRKHFKLPASAKDLKVFVEFEGLKQAAHFWINGKPIGKFENGITACGLDLTGLVNVGDQENVLAVKVDNSATYVEETTHTAFEWMGKAFNPNYGGLNHDVWLHLAGKVYQTLPLYENLQTTGVYIYGTNFDVAGKSCDVTVEAQVRNDSGDQAASTLSVVVVDRTGHVCATFTSDACDQVAGETDTVIATGKLTSAHFWSPADPVLYDVYTILTVKDQVVDVCRHRTGFRKAEYKGGAGKGGVWLNDAFVYLQGYAQRAANDWAGLGQAYPDWMHQYTIGLMAQSHANYIRWMHISPQRVDVSACDQAGIVEVCPAGDKEKDVVGRAWDQRTEVMRDSLIYYRNQPSILFWEAGNNTITPAHLKEMVDLRQTWDPHGGRVMGCRTLDDPGATPIAEYYGVMIGQDPRTDALKTPTELFRAYSVERRDRAPLIETEDFRDESARRFWDPESPPHFGFKKGPKDTYEYTSESFALAGAKRFDEYYRNRISNVDPAHAKWSGYASIYFSDSDADGRQDSSEVARVSGKVDSVRLPKEMYFVERVMQSATPDIHIIGHWTYPKGTKKTVYVAASHCDSVTLTLNGKVIGKSKTAQDDFIFAFPDISLKSGTLGALGEVAGQAACHDEVQTAGQPVALKLTSSTGPNGLQADGADVAFFDVEVVDADGRRCPTDEARVDFTVTGPAIWRGGYNSGKLDSTNNLYLDTEDGINRVAIRSTGQAGEITLTATRQGLAPATLTLSSVAVPLEGGLTTALPQASAGPIESAPDLKG